MKIRALVMLLIVIFLSCLMMLYILPFNTVNFMPESSNYNFSVLGGEQSMQFYPNMRFPKPEISYRIPDCPLQQKDDMEYAFEIVEGLTPLTFYPVTSNEEILIGCSEEEIFHHGLFIAGEGGPTNITVAGQFNVISYGNILLIQESNCPKPNIALHELFHVLGFEHSTNPSDIMYSVSNCDQEIGEDMIQKINVLYSIPSRPDLIFKDASASISGRFLNINMTIINAGLDEAGESTITIYADGNVVKEVDVDGLKIGTGRIITISNIFISRLNVKEIKLVINDNFQEISKDNNEMKLEIS